MDLQRGERLVRPGRAFWPLAETLLFTGAIFLFELKEAGLLVAAVWGLVLVAHAAAILYNHRQVLFTDRRIVEFRPALAWLARRRRALGGLDLGRFERDRRRSIDLLEIASTRHSGPSILIRTTSGDEHTVSCRTEEEAILTRREIEEDARQARQEYHDALLRQSRAERMAQRLVTDIRITTGASGRQPAAPARCPYCHDDVDDEEAACDRCATRHHAECLEIHGGCAVAACGGRAVRRGVGAG